MKKFISFIVAFVLAISILNTPGVLRADNEMTAEQQVNAINIGWNLGNTLDSYGTWITDVTPQSVETAWGNPVTTRQMIAAVRERGFNTIRIPVTWAQFTDENGNVDEAWMARVKQVVDWALDEGLYVILNVHHDTGEHGQDKVCWLIADTGTIDSVRERFTNLWTNIANEFKTYDNRLMFEGYNEILDMNNSWNAPTAGDGAYDAVNELAQLFVDAVRSTGENNATRNLIVNTYVASCDLNALSRFVLPEDTVEDHLIVEVHAYTPYQFCSAEGDSSYTSFDDNCRVQVDMMLHSLASFSSTVRVPVIIGEFGVENQNNDQDRADYAAYYVSSATMLGLRCIWWDNGISDYGGYGILDRNSLTWNEGIASALIDNAPDGIASQDEPDEEETSESSEVPETSVGITETTAPSEQTEPVAASDASAAVSSEYQADSGSHNINTNQKSHIVLWIVGGVAVAVSYAGLFLLGRKRGKNK